MLMNRMKTARVLTAVLVLMLCLIGLSSRLLPVSASENGGRVYDDAADLLTDAEEATLAAQMEELSAKYGAEFYMATYNAYGYSDDFVGDDYCASVEDISRFDAVLFVITYDRYDGEYYYDIYIYGRADSAISDKEVNYILDADAVYNNIKSGKLSDGAAAFFDLSAKAYDGRVGVSYAVIIPVCAVLAILISLLVVKGVKDSYSRKHASADYPLDRFARLELTARSDTFAGTAVTRSYSPRSRSSGGGGRSGGSSAHGGGSGHRGGR